MVEMIDVKQMMPRTEQMVRQTTCCRRSTMHPKKSKRDATDRESSKPRRRNVAKMTPSKNRIQVQRRRKAKPRLRKNCSQCSSCRSADSCANLNKSYSSEYVSYLVVISFSSWFRITFHLICHGYVFLIFGHVPLFFHPFSMFFPTRHSVYLYLL